MAYKNKSDQAEYCKRHYKKYKPIYIKRSRIAKTKAIKRNRKFIDEYLRSHPCTDCGFKDIRCLEFDHIKNKFKPISLMVQNGSSIKNIEKEIEKCEVRCANCHRIKTYLTLWKK